MALETTSAPAGKLVIRNIGLLLSGDLARPVLDADTVVAVSQVLADGLRSRGIEPLLVPNGVDVSVFQNAGVPSADGGHPPVTAFVGHLS